jgi:Zn finger protein HypA/HybF involved in hydrogenase expression
MKISRATFGRIVERARNKVVDAILHGKAIRIGSEFPVELKEKRAIRCKKCGSVKKENSLNKTCNKCKKNKQGEII